MSSFFPSLRVVLAGIRVTPAFRLFALVTLALSAANAQSTASLSGRVLDPSGAVLPQATLVLRHAGGSAVRTTNSDAAGGFLLDRLTPGEYELAVAREGFTRHVEKVTVTAGAPQTLNLTLEPGGFAEELTVVATQIVGTPEMARSIAGSVEVIDPVTLENARVQNFGEALRKLSGVSVRDEEGFGLRPNIGIRGLNPTRSSKVLLLEDGVPLAYAPYGDNASYYHPPVERFSSIEVMKGSGQIVHGPVTVGGVVNYITPDPPSDFEGNVTLLGGSRNYLNGNLQLGGTWAGTGLLLDFTRKQGDGARENIRSGLNDVNLKAVRSIGDHQSLTLKGNYYGEDSNVTYSGLRLDEYTAGPRSNPFRNDFFYGDRWGASLTHTYLLNHGVLFSTSAYFSRFARDWWRQSSNSSQRPNDAGDPACGGMANLDTTCGNEGRLRRYETWGIAPAARTEYSLLGLRQQSDFGVRVHFERQHRYQKNGPLPDSRDGVLVENNIRENQAYSAFWQQRVHVGRFVITPGVRLERIFFERNNVLLDASGKTDLTQVVPGIGVAYSPTQSLTLFGGVHRGFAPPRTEDVINNSTGGVVELDPELSWNYEFGARSVPFRGLRLDATFFRMDYENQIVPASLAGGVGTQLTNGGETLHQGMELAARVDTGVLRASRHNLYFSTTYTWLPVNEFAGTRFSNVPGFSSIPITGNRLPYAPEHLLNLTVGYSHPRGFDMFVEAVHVSDQFADDLNTVSPTPDGQRGLVDNNTTWNATLNVPVEQWHSTFFFTVKNLLNETFVVDRARGMIPNNPRLLQTGLKFRF